MKRQAPRATGKAVIVGSGPNGLTCAAVLARIGWDVEVFEANPDVGGAASSAEVLGEATVVDRGAAAHPFGVASPVFRDLDLERFGVTWCHSEHAMAHPLERQPAALLDADLDITSARLGVDAAMWKRLHRHLTVHIDEHLENVLSPMTWWPAHPMRLAQFGSVGALPAATLVNRLFQGEPAKALLVGSAAHSITPPTQAFTGGFGLLFGALGMTRGWPVAAGGTGTIPRALASVVVKHGGRIHVETRIDDARALPKADAVILNLTPRQVVDMRALTLPPRVRASLKRWPYGSGVYKVDYLLTSEIPWLDPEVNKATTVHVGGSSSEVTAALRTVAEGSVSERPFVLLCQQQAADASRAPHNRRIAWAYGHVPRGYRDDHPGAFEEIIRAQIERFAPGFKDVVERVVVSTPIDLNTWNANLIGGDIAGGAMSGLQSLVRPRLTLAPYRLAPGLYMASASTPPGAGVHGMAGYWAAQTVMADFTRA